MLPVVLIRLDSPKSAFLHLPVSLGVALTHEWQAAVVADRDLGLVGVDENARVSGGTAAAITGHHAVVCPAHGLLVDELHGGVGLRLRDDSQVSNHTVVRVKAPGPRLGAVKGSQART